MTDVKVVRVVHLMLLVYAAGAVGQATFVGVHSGWRQPVLVLLMLLNFAEIMQSALFIADDTVEPKSLWRALWYIPGCGHLLLLPLFIPTLTSLMGAMEESWPLHLASHGWRPSRKQLALSWVVGLALSATSAAVLLTVTPEKGEVMDTDIYVFEADHPGLRALQVLPILLSSFCIVGVGTAAGLLWHRWVLFTASLLCFVTNIPNVPVFRYVISSAAEVSLFVAITWEIGEMFERGGVEEKQRLLKSRANYWHPGYGTCECVSVQVQDWSP